MRSRRLPALVAPPDSAVSGSSLNGRLTTPIGGGLETARLTRREDRSAQIGCGPENLVIGRQRTIGSSTAHPHLPFVHTARAELRSLGPPSGLKAFDVVILLSDPLIFRRFTSGLDPGIPIGTQVPICRINAEMCFEVMDRRSFLSLLAGCTAWPSVSGRGRSPEGAATTRFRRKQSFPPQ
jgi:hypothetical protein